MNTNLLRESFYTLCLIAFAVILTTARAEAAGKSVRLNKPPNYLSTGNGLVGYWSFDGKDTVWTTSTAGTTLDKSGSGNTGTLTNMSQSLTPVAGKIGQGLNFDNVNDTITASNTNFKTISSVTLSAWVNLTAIPGSGICKTIMAAGGSGSRNLQMYLCTNYLSFSGLWFYSIATGEIHSNNTALTLGWHHWAEVYDGTNTGNRTMTFYLDGAAIGTVSALGAMTQSSGTTFIIGNDFFSSTMNGIMDEIRIYNRPLAASEILFLSRAGSARITKTPAESSNLTAGLVGWWTFDGNKMYQNIADSSGSGNNGSLSMGASGNTSTTTVPGVSGQALSFDGVDDKVSFTGISTGATYTLSLWMFPIPTSDGYAALLTNDSNNGLYYLGTSRLLDMYNGPEYTNTTGLTENKWNHVVVVSNGAGGAINFYLNGVPNGTSAAAGFSFTLNRMGDDSGSETYKGSLDDVRLYNRALSPAEVTQLYNYGKTKVKP